MTTQQTQNDYHCNKCNFRTFRIIMANGVFVLTCVNCSTQYVIAMALGQIQQAPEKNDVKQ